MSSEDIEQRRARSAAVRAIEGEIADLEERLRAHGETPSPVVDNDTRADGENDISRLRERRRMLRDQLARARSRPRRADDAEAGTSQHAPSNPVGALPPRGRRPGKWQVPALALGGLLAGLLVREYLQPAHAPAVPVGGLRLSIEFAADAPDDTAAIRRLAFAASLAREPGIHLVAAPPGAGALPVQKAAARAGLRLVVAPRETGAGWRLTLLAADAGADTPPLWQHTLIPAEGEDDASFAARAAAAAAAGAARDTLPEAP